MSEKNILQRLHAAMGEVDYIQKEKKAGMRYSIVSHDAVTAKVRPVLVKHGIMYYPVDSSRSQSGNRTEMDLTVRFCNIDDRSDFIDVVATGYGVDDQDKGPGKAISYAVKYALLKVLGLETGDDPDQVQDDSAKHREDKPSKTNVRLSSEINQLTSPPLAKQWWHDNEKEILALSEEQQNDLDAHFRNKLDALESGNVTPGPYKFGTVGESNEFAKEFVDKLSVCNTLIAVNNLVTANKMKLDSLLGQYQGKMNKDIMADRINAKRKELEPNILNAG